ncbi:Lambda repressor-like, DNA-binding domain [Desulfitobacterium hafniense]|uniref:Lambda repressor-like, DNA-binding domain n=1 Tax=Desulfitobacterium hafniense TaxID=49338 RepID=A0A098AVW3_DESHA|nr:DUF739 family protein [Desulfitobacterium hafniense]CDX00733.1 Lambda repressor-like, DNA-binding domain [Desulfitobacterium hafniense]
MTNTSELEVAIVRAKKTKKEIAKHLGISPMGLYKKINNDTEFKASEISKLVTLLNIEPEERELIFFSQNSDFKSHNTQRTKGA